MNLPTPPEAEAETNEVADHHHPFVHFSPRRKVAYIPPARNLSSNTFAILYYTDEEIESFRQEAIKELSKKSQKRESRSSSRKATSSTSTATTLLPVLTTVPQSKSNDDEYDVDVDKNKVKPIMDRYHPSTRNLVKHRRTTTTTSRDRTQASPPQRRIVVKSTSLSPVRVSSGRKLNEDSSPVTSSSSRPTIGTRAKSERTFRSTETGSSSINRRRRSRRQQLVTSKSPPKRQAAVSSVLPSDTMPKRPLLISKSKSERTFRTSPRRRPSHSTTGNTSRSIPQRQGAHYYQVSDKFQVIQF